MDDLYHQYISEYRKILADHGPEALGDVASPFQTIGLVGLTSIPIAVLRASALIKVQQEAIAQLTRATRV